MTIMEKLLTREEAAEWLGIRPQTLAAWATTRRHLPFVKIGDKVVRYRRSDLEAYLAKQTVKPPELGGHVREKCNAYQQEKTEQELTRPLE